MTPLRRRNAVVTALAAAVAIALGQAPRATVEAQAGVLIQVNAAADRRTIDPRIYGVNWATAAQLQALNAPVHRWGGNSMEVSDARRLRQLEDENRRLKSVVADLTLDNQALRAVLGKRW
jgi:hypothetical protein